MTKFKHDNGEWREHRTVGAGIGVDAGQHGEVRGARLLLLRPRLLPLFRSSTGTDGIVSDDAHVADVSTGTDFFILLEPLYLGTSVRRTRNYSMKSEHS